jgi:bzd-type benzoyl-CoA reductase N subunit
MRDTAGLHGLARLDELYKSKEAIAREQREQGKKIIGYLCYFAPPEMISAAGMVPYRILGKMGDEIIQAHNYVEPLGCPYIRNCFEQDLKGHLDFLDGRIIPHSCDTAQRLYGIWKYYKTSSYNYCLNVPHKVTPWSRKFFQEELAFFRESLEKFGGKEITDAGLRDMIRLYNANRALVRELYDLRKGQPPCLSGTEMFKTLIVGMTIPPEDFHTLLREILADIGKRPVIGGPLPRILFWGCILDDIRLFEVIEESGSWIVTDDICIGTKSYLRQIDMSGDPLDGLTRGYFEEFMCPRTDRGPDIRRFNYVLDLIKDFHVQGVVAYTLSFCDPYKLDYPDLRDYLAEKGVPTLLIDDDYTLSHLESIRTRVEAFIETLG